MERQRGWRRARPTTLRPLLRANSSDHVVNGEHLEIGAVSLDLPHDRLTLATDRSCQSPLGVPPCRHSGLNGLSSRDRSLPLSRPPVGQTRDDASVTVSAEGSPSKVSFDLPAVMTDRHETLRVAPPAGARDGNTDSCPDPNRRTRRMARRRSTIRVTRRADVRPSRRHMRARMSAFLASNSAAVITPASRSSPSF